MIFGQDKQELRQMYVDAWQKYRSGNVLAPLEAQIAEVIADHPEYQSTMTSTTVGESYTPEGGQTNPFLHMGLHLAIREQVNTNRPPGIAAIFSCVLRKTGDAHSAEHQMLDCLAETLWEAQRANAMPDEQAYLERLRQL